MFDVTHTMEQILALLVLGKKIFIRACFGLVLSLVSISLLQAQATLFPNGYIITLQGDTINGTISAAPTLNQYSMIQFKRNENDWPEQLTPFDIRGYSIFKDYQLFVSAKLPNQQSGNSNEKPQVLFLKALVLGKTSLFMGRDSTGVRRYFLAKDTHFLELKHLRKIINELKRPEIVPDKSFLQIFNLLLADCDSKKYDFPFAEQELINQVQQYNACGEEKRNKKDFPKLKLPNDGYSNFANALIVTTKGDTLRGIIRYVNEKDLNILVRFRRTEKDPEIVFGPREILFYQIGNSRRQFEPIEHLEFFPDKNRDDRKVIESCFVEMIVKGKASLFKIRDRDNQEHLFISKDGKSYELRYKMSKIDGSKFQSLLYNGILNIVLGDCNISAHYDILFRIPYIIRAVVEYNNCRHSKSKIFRYRGYSKKVMNLQF